MEKFYDKREDLTKQKASAKLNKEKFPLKGDLKKLDRIADKLSDINKEIRSIESSRMLTAAQKRTQIEVLLKKRNELVGNTMKAR